MYTLRDLYGAAMSPSTLDLTIPEPEEQEALANTEGTAPVVQNKGSIMTWLGIIVLFVVLYHIGGKK
jgi:hypothetical protein